MGVSLWLVMSTLLTIGVAAGFLMYRSDFCMASAFRDVFLFKSVQSLHPLVLLIILSAALFEVCRLLNFLPFYPFPWFGPPSVANMFGGMVSGLGMVLAGGCVVGVLYKMGGGSLLAAVAFAGLLVGSALYAEIHPWWLSLSKQTVFSTMAVTLPQLLSVPPIIVILAFVFVGAFFCLRWQKAGMWSIQNAAEGFIPKWMTACSLSLLGLFTVLVTGGPMGVTTSYAKAASLIESWVNPQHIAELSYFTAQPVKYIIPVEGVVRYGGAGPSFDVIAILQFPLIAGIVLGSALSAASLGELQMVWQVPIRQVSMVFAGGVIMALGARMTPGCNVWHLWGGIPILTMQSLLFVIGLLPGAWLGSKILQRVLITKL